MKSRKEKFNTAMYKLFQKRSKGYYKKNSSLSENYLKLQNFENKLSSLNYNKNEINLSLNLESSFKK